MSDLTCSVNDGDCTKPTDKTYGRFKKGLCIRHYQQAQKQGMLAWFEGPTRTLMSPTCTVGDCSNVTLSKGMCGTHYMRVRRFGDVNATGQTYNCIICGKPFYKFAQQVCCSYECKKERVAEIGYYKRRRALECEARRHPQAERFSRKEIFDRDGWICQLCGLPIEKDLPHRSSGSASLDHILPLVLGGIHNRANSQAAHYGCNARKGARIM